MADSAANNPPPPTTTSSSSGFFSRRPSLFGGKGSKGHAKGSRASVSYTHSRSTASPPALTLPPSTPEEPPHVLSQSADSPRVPTTPQQRKPNSRHSIASSVTDIGSSLRRSRSASLRTNTSAGTTSTSSHRRTPSATLALTYSPEKTPNAAATNNGSRPTLSISTFSRSKQKSSENVKPDGTNGAQVYEKSPLSAVDKPKTPFGMAVPLSSRHPPSQKDILQANRQANTQLAPSAPIPLPNGANPNVIFQHIQEMASKRISTLDYLRKACVYDSVIA